MCGLQPRCKNLVRAWSGKSCVPLGASATPPSSHIPSLSPLSLDFLYLCVSLILILGTLSHSLFLYVYDLNDSDLRLQSIIFLLNFLLFENDFVIHYNSRLFLLILAFFLFSFSFFPCQHAST